MSNRPDPGTYRAKVSDYALTENDNGQLTLTIRFAFGNAGLGWAWTGTFGSEKAKERTLKTLMTLGLKSDDLERLADGPASGMLDLDLEVECVVEQSEYEGKTRTQITYVNPVGGKMFGTAVSKDKARVQFGGMNLKGLLGQYGFKPKAEAEAKADLGSIPF